MPDDKPPPQPTTVQLEAPPPWAIEMAKNIVTIRGTTETLVNEVGTLRVDVRSLQQWRLDEERRRDSATDRPPPITSIRVREVIEEHPSRLDLESQAKLAELETWRKTVATKDDLATAAQEQNAVIVDGVKAALKDPLVKKALSGLIALLIAATSYAMGHLQEKAEHPPTQQVAK